MKNRKWLMQEKDRKDPDDVLIERLLKRDALLEGGSVEFVSSADTYDNSYIPIGDIPFIEGWLQHNYGKHMQPIEVPEVLRTDEFLKRSYRFVDRDKLPAYEDGKLKYFVKNVDKLKEFNSSMYDGRIPFPSTLPSGQYLISGWVDIRSEFRMFVHRDQILAVQNYLGSPLVFPDAKKLVKMVEIYKTDPNRPKAYTMDVAVICQKDESAETVILEVHPFAACGLYGFNDMAIPNMLEDGIRYYAEQKEENI